jgi:hypothetical protein
LQEICLFRIKEHIDERRITVCTYMYAVTNTDKSNLDSTEMFSEANIKMLAFLADNIFGKCLVDVYFNRQTAYI